jgi:hypothetical protein
MALLIKCLSHKHIPAIYTLTAMHEPMSHQIPDYQYTWCLWMLTTMKAQEWVSLDIFNFFTEVKNTNKKRPWTKCKHHCIILTCSEFIHEWSTDLSSVCLNLKKFCPPPVAHTASYQVHVSPLLDPVLSQVSPVHIFTPCFFKSHFSNLPLTALNSPFSYKWETSVLNRLCAWIVRWPTNASRY